VIEIAPRDIDAYFNMGVAYIKNGMFKEAINIYEKAIKINPYDPEIHYYLGIAFINIGEIDSAIEEYNNAIRLKPDYAEAYNSLENAYYDKNMLDEALSAYSDSFDWKWYSLENDKFSVLFPSEPNRFTKTNDGVEEIHYLSDVMNGEVSYLMRYAEFDNPEVSPYPQEALDAASTTVVKMVNGRVLSENHISYQEYPGRKLTIEIDVDDGKKALVISKMYLVKNATYNLIVYTPIKHQTKPEHYKFLDSFRLEKIEPATVKDKILSIRRIGASILTNQPETIEQATNENKIISSGRIGTSNLTEYERNDYIYQVLKDDPVYLNIVDSQIFGDYLNELTSYQYKEAKQIMETGSKEDIIKLISDYEKQLDHQKSYRSMVFKMLNVYENPKYRYTRIRHAKNVIKDWLREMDNNAELVRFGIRKTGKFSYLLNYSIAKNTFRYDHFYKINSNSIRTVKIVSR
jgi:tetratricopeptide (TPR) repeat protein